jgi:hypothetical protein
VRVFEKPFVASRPGTCSARFSRTTCNDRW